MKRFLIALALFSVCFGSVSHGSIDVVRAQEPVALNSEDVVALTKPAVVRIAQHVKGTATIPAIKINLKDRSVSVDASKPSQTVPIDETLSGSGFIVSSDGYIVTNSHVVSLTTVKIDAMTNIVMAALFENAPSLSEEEANQLFQDEGASFDFIKTVFSYVSDHSVFDVKQTMVVMNPSSRKEKFDDLITEGFPVQVVSVNDRFYEDDKDVALIKIDQQNLPTISLGSSDMLGVGKHVSIFGFPATAEFNQRNPLESTFTQGVISALKDSEKRDFKVFQTDAKVSEGSSGGPLVDETGRVSGIITFQSNQLQKTSGDNFAFALPIELATSMIAEYRIDIQPSTYRDRLVRGSGFVSEQHCSDAQREFDGLRNTTNSLFDVNRYIAPYLARCQSLIDSGQSIDTPQSRVKHFVRQISPASWMAIGIVVVFALSLSFVIWWLIREVNREERAIRMLENRLHEEESRVYSDRRSVKRIIGRKKS